MPNSSRKIRRLGIELETPPFSSSSSVSAATSVVIPVPSGVRSLGPQWNAAHGVGDAPRRPNASGGASQMRVNDVELIRAPVRASLYLWRTRNMAMERKYPGFERRARRRMNLSPDGERFSGGI